MRSYYLESPDEPASNFILQELGVTILSVCDSIFGNVYSMTRIHPLATEHKSDFKCTYKVIEGEVNLDIRDSADAWIRCHLSTGNSVIVNSGLYHRFTHEYISVVKIAMQSSNECNDSNKNSYQSRFYEEKDSLVMIPRSNIRQLICDLCSQFYDAGWVTGTGGSISIRHGNRIYMTPSGVPKERILPEDLFLLDRSGAMLQSPLKKPGAKHPKLTDCSPLFFHCYQIRDAGAVIHSHDISCVLAIALSENELEFRISHQEMIKGITGHGYHDELIIPIIENTAFENELADSLKSSILAYPRSPAVLVRNHGVYVWGETWEVAKRHSECLHYLFGLSVELHKLKLSCVGEVGSKGKIMQNLPSFNCGYCDSLSSKSIDATSYKCVLLDIEGTTTPITFVKDTLFPYAKENVLGHVLATWQTEETKMDVTSILRLAENDIKSYGASATFPNEIADFLSNCSNKDFSTLDSSIVAPKIASYVHWCIEEDRKVEALKTLQGHIWEQGYCNGSIVSQVYDDVPPFLVRMQNAGVRTCIYSSGSRDAQRLLFKHSTHGDLRNMLACYFDTTVGQKRTSESYKSIILSLGVDNSNQVLFVTDVYEEAAAAKTAGCDVVISVRPGNAELPVGSSSLYKIRSFDEI